MRKLFFAQRLNVDFIKRAAVLVAAVAVFTLALIGDTHFAEASGATSACVAMEPVTRTVLYSRNADVHLPMASTTKIMTALIVCEECDPDRIISVPAEAAGVEGSSIYLRAGEEIDVRDLLYGLMLRSGNDAAVALAITHSGSVESFVDKMNARAAELCAHNTHFLNPNGLPAEGHYTTARDLCTIACAAMQNNLFREVVGTKSWHGRYRSYANKNKMLYNYEGATGVKTGYTVKAGRCLVSSAERGGMEVVCALLNEYDMYAVSASVLDSCFEKFALYALSPEKVFMCGGVPCSVDKTYKFVARRSDVLRYECTPQKSALRCENKSACGKLKIYSGNSLIFGAKLYSII
ncbi:MAG TPA: D-alanyl-D-alanine carboxypeptidase [Candidatus Coproplasma excrementavium]|nr:D-alanyl-D-alanine carboxypeptidase [Candidatus Coproplasma excrementavium]